MKTICYKMWVMFEVHWKLLWRTLMILLENVTDPLPITSKVTIIFQVMLTSLIYLLVQKINKRWNKINVFYTLNQLSFVKTLLPCWTCNPWVVSLSVTALEYICPLTQSTDESDWKGDWKKRELLRIRPLFQWNGWSIVLFYFQRCSNECTSLWG